MPDPETKEDHMQKSNILELIFTKFEGMEYGVVVEIALKKTNLK